MQTVDKKVLGEWLQAVQRRLPARQRWVQEAFTTEHRHAVTIKISDLEPEMFYVLDDMVVQACSAAAVDLSARHGGGRLVICFPFYGEFQAQQRRLQQVARNQESIRVLSVGRMQAPAELPSRVEFENLPGGSVLTRYRLVLNDGAQPFGFICREMSARRNGNGQIGFFTMDDDIVEALISDVEAVLRGVTKRMETFERLQLLHQTTQKVVRELESYSRRMELAIDRARRRPDLLTPARFERIVNQAIAKMEELKEVPLRALRTMSKPRD